VGAIFSTPVQTGPGAHLAICTICTGSFLGVESGRGVTLTPHPLLVPRSKNRVLLYLLELLSLRAFVACKRVKLIMHNTSVCLTDSTLVLKKQYGITSVGFHWLRIGEKCSDVINTMTNLRVS
jgi:hypothetical protein